MPQFICKLGSPDGTLLTKELDACNELQLRDGLTGQGYHIFSITKCSGSLCPSIGFLTRRIGTNDLISLNQELLVLFKAGMPIIPILDSLLEHRAGGDVNLYRVLTQAREEVKAGMSFSAALERQEAFFPPLYLASLRAGETTGDLSGIISRYIAYIKRVDAVRKKMLSSLFYPTILVTVAIAAISLLLIYVVPTFSQVYADAGSQLPLVTRMLISFSNGMRNSAIVWLPGLLLTGVGLQRWRRSPAGRQKLDALKLKLPFVGDLFFCYAVAGFSRTLATLLGSGIPLVESLKMSSGTLDNHLLEQGMGKVVRQVEEGGRLGAALEQHRLMPPLALRMLGVGEETGALEEMLTAVAEHLEETIEEKSRLLSSAVEPAVMLVMGVVIGFIIVAMYLPIFKLAGTVGA